MTWHLLQVSDVLDIEFGSALAERVPLLAWEPERGVLPPLLQRPSNRIRLTEPNLQIRSFPVMRGYTRFPLSLFSNGTGKKISQFLLENTDDPHRSPLVCTNPYVATVAENWPGPVVYWLTDRIESYHRVNRALVHRLDRRMCRVATLLCPNSQRLAEYLTGVGVCNPGKIRVLPNATRSVNLLPDAPEAPGQLPLELRDLPRPIAGVIGNLAGNMDWSFLERLISKVPHIHWAFVGPTGMPVLDPKESGARERVMRLPNARFTGKQAYGDLATFARSFDVAVLPYRRCEPTYSGSSTRFYEHLAACRPMIATRGFEELLSKEPLLCLVDTPEQAAEQLLKLEANNFDDGHAIARWQASQQGTWQVRAETMCSELASAW